MKILKRPRQLRRCLGRSQDHRNDRTSPLHELVKKSLNLLALPGTEPTLAHKNRCRFYTFDLLSKRRLPGGSGSDFLFIQPRFDAFLDQLLRDLADGWLVLAIVAQEDIKDFRFGVLSVHTEAIL